MTIRLEKMVVFWYRTLFVLTLLLQRIFKIAVSMLVAAAASAEREIREVSIRCICCENKPSVHEK